MICIMAILLSAFTGSVFGGTESPSNTFYGLGAGASIDPDGYDNTFIGRFAGYSTTTGDRNTFLGYAAGYYNTTGNYNIFLGYYAGYWNTTGNYNIFLGDYAGHYNTTGFYNTFLGNYAGFDNTTGSRNVFLGYLAGRYETGSNKLYVDSSSTSTPLIYGEFDNNILTINGNLSVVAPDNGLIYLTDVTTDNTTKGARMVLNHYSNAELPVYLFGAASTSTNNFVAFGGGADIGNAATEIDLFTAPIRPRLRLVLPD